MAKAPTAASSNMNQKSIPEIKIVYKRDYAASMIAMGHRLIDTMPNPVNEKYTCWIFEDDDSFYDDLHEVIVRGRHKNG